MKIEALKYCFETRGQQSYPKSKTEGPKIWTSVQQKLKKKQEHVSIGTQNA